MSKFVCKCEVCTDAEQYMAAVLSLRGKKHRDFLVKFYDKYCNEMLDANVNEAIIQGTWANADEIIKFQREKVQKEMKNGITKR